jgi:hypothetical protein
MASVADKSLISVLRRNATSEAGKSAASVVRQNTDATVQIIKPIAKIFFKTMLLSAFV